MKLIVGYLYPDLMNIYGDTGNIISLQKRSEWRGIDVKVINISLGAKLNHLPGGTSPDIYFFGGGQDQAQQLVAEDLQKSGKGEEIKADVERGVPLLSICGGYQLLGDYYQPHQGPKLPGISLFPAYTVASYDRMIGNIVIKVQGSGFRACPESDRRVHGKDNDSTNHELKSQHLLVGFENHSGKTYLKEGAQPLGTVVSGFGNNGEDKSEGCIYKNAVGCYMHGSLLPKNPHLADWFLKTALEVKYQQEIKLKPLDDTFEWNAHQVAISRFSR